MPRTVQQRCLLQHATPDRKPAASPDRQPDAAYRAVEASDAPICKTGRRSLRRVHSVATPGGVRLVGIVPADFDRQTARECVLRCGVPVTEDAITVTEWAE